MGKTWKGLPVVIFGIGGFAKEVKILIDDINSGSNIPVFDFIGFISNTKDDIGKLVEGKKIISCNEEFIEFSKMYDKLGIVIALGAPSAKEQIERELLDKCDKLVYPNLIHPRANITSSISNDLGMGNIICCGVTITTNIKLGKFVIININSTIGHDVIIEDYCTVNPLVAVSGNVSIKKGALIGAGVSIKEKTLIGKNSIAGLGAIVVKEIEDNSVVISKRATQLER